MGAMLSVIVRHKLFVFCLQIVYITATLPLILLIIFFFRGVHLKGYQEGLALLFIPEVRLKSGNGC